MPRLPLKVLLAATTALSCTHGSHPAPQPSNPSPRIVGYLASWGVRSKGTRIADLPGDQLTHIVYAFARITEDGRFALGDPCLDVGQCTAPPAAPLPSTDRGNFAELRRLKERYPNLTLMIAAGGWTGSGRFSDIALTAESPTQVRAIGVDVVIRRSPGLFDGIDIDWEYPVGGRASAMDASTCSRSPRSQDHRHRDTSIS
jgi:chitinase